MCSRWGIRDCPRRGHIRLKEVIDSGEIGQLLCAQATSARNSLLGEWNYRIEPEGTPQNIDWARWLGSAQKRPFSPDRYFRFRKYWDYSGGIATDLFFHSLGPILYPMGAQFPTRVSAGGGIYVHKDREVPDTYSTTIEYPNFYIDMSGSMANAAMGQYHRQAIYGHKGTLVVEGNRVMVQPESFPEQRQTAARRRRSSNCRWNVRSAMRGRRTRRTSSPASGRGNSPTLPRRWVSDHCGDQARGLCVSGGEDEALRSGDATDHRQGPAAAGVRR